MRSLVSTSLATAIALLLATNVHADDLELELKLKLGGKRTVTVAKVDTGDNEGIGFRMDLRESLPPRFFKSDKKYLALWLAGGGKRPTPSGVRVAHYPAMLIAIPWDSIKEIRGEKKNDWSTVTCVGDAKFTGTILTEVANADDEKYHLGDCTEVKVKNVTKSGEPDYAGPDAKCRVGFNKLDQSFNARWLGYRTGNETSKKFQMRVDGKELGGNLSNYDKVRVEGSEKGAIKITVRAPEEEETPGDLLFSGQATFLFEGAKNDCAIVLRLRAQAPFGGDAEARQATFTVTIESTKAGKSLPLEMFIPKKE